MRKQIPLRIDLEDLERLEDWSKKLDLPREVLVRNLIRVGMDDLALAHSIGLLSLVQFLKVQKEKGKALEKILPCFSS